VRPPSHLVQWGDDMRNQALVVVGAAVLTAAVIVVVALVAFNTGTKHPAGPAARPGTSTSPSTSPSTGAPAGPPAPTVTVTKRQAPPPSDVAPPRPQYAGGDEAFLEMIAADGITAPDGWALEAGRKTCGQSYDEAYRYLTDGGLYDHHVQTFLDDWSATHDGC
jgi:hypothetical protein